MITPREHDLVPAAARAFDRMDPVIGSYTGRGRRLDVRIAVSLPRRQQVLAMRVEHYQSTLASLGVAAWDQHDESAVQMLCCEADRPVGSLRLVPNTRDSGDLVDDFGDLREVVSPAAFAMFGRALVVPERRASGVFPAIVHAASTWWRRNVPAKRMLLTSLLNTVPACSALGAKVLSAPLRLGPQRIQVVLMEVDLDQTIERAQRWLTGHGWSLR